MMMEFNSSEVEMLRRMVVMWIDEGFTTPPYDAAAYDIFEKLGIDNETQVPYSNGNETFRTLGYDVGRREGT